MKEENIIQAQNALVDLRKLTSGVKPEEIDDAWRKQVLDAYTKFAQATGIVARDSDAYGPLDFVAKILMQYDRGAEMRWALMSETEREVYRQQAINAVASWANEELQLERLRSGSSIKLTK